MEMNSSDLAEKLKIVEKEQNLESIPVEDVKDDKKVLERLAEVKPKKQSLTWLDKVCEL